MRDGSYAESEAYDSASVVPIHTRSELSSDSVSAYDSASVASVPNVNQPLCFNCFLYYGKRGCENQREMKPGEATGDLQLKTTTSGLKYFI